MGLVSDAVNILVEMGGHTMTGPLAMSANKVTAVAEPTSPHDAATKNYVDTRGYATMSYADSRDSKLVQKICDTMTGCLAMSANKITAVADPTYPHDAAKKTMWTHRGVAMALVWLSCVVWVLEQRIIVQSTSGLRRIYPLAPCSGVLLAMKQPGTLWPASLQPPKM